MKAGRGDAGGSASQSEPRAIEINNWSIFAHPLFLDQVESLTAAVEAEVARGKRDTSNMKVLRAVYRFAFAEIPRDPGDARFRLGNTMGPEYRHWFRAKFGNGRFRLFYRFRSQANIIVLAWVNDDATLRTRGDRKRDAYAVFRRMLRAGNPPDSWDLLYEAATSEPSVRRLMKLGPEGE